ncbi:hypothetical protein, partial [Ferruginibacter sp. HRS2-29]
TTVPEYNAAGFFQKFDIYYDRDNYQPAKMRFSYFEPAPQEEDVVTTMYLQNKTVDINFSAYSRGPASDLFNEAKYVIYNRQRKIYEPGQKFRNYRFLTSGFLNEDEDAQYYNQAPFEYIGVQ